MKLQCCLFTPDVGTKSDYQAFKCRYINLFSCILLSVVNLYLKVICDERKVNKTPSPYQILQYLKSPSCLNFIDRPKHPPTPMSQKKSYWSLSRKRSWGNRSLVKSVYEDGHAHSQSDTSPLAPLPALCLVIGSWMEWHGLNPWSQRWVVVWWLSCWFQHRDTCWRHHTRFCTTLEPRKW